MNNLKIIWLGGKHIKYFANGMEVSCSVYCAAVAQNERIEAKRWSIRVRNFCR